MKKIILLGFILISACTGGDDNAPGVPVPTVPSLPGAPPTMPTTPVPPADTNTAPALIFSFPNDPVFERQGIEIDASETRDADGDEITLTLETGDLPVLRDEGTVEGITFILVTDDVDETTTYPLTLTASDGTDTVSETFEVTVANYERTPINTTWGDVSQTLDVATNGSARFASNFIEDEFKMLHLMRATEDDKLEIIEFNYERGFTGQTVIPLDIAAAEDAEFAIAKILPSDASQSFAVSVPSREEVEIFQRTSHSTAESVGRGTHAGLCAVAWAFVDLRPRHALAPSLFLATAHDLWALLNESAIKSAPSQPGAFIDMLPFESTANYCHAGRFGTFYSASTQEFIFLAAGISGEPNFPRRMPIFLPEGVELVAFQDGRLKYDVKFFALLFAGDAHDGPHRLIILHETPSGVIEQLNYELPPGIPSDIVVKSIDTNYIDLQFGRSEGNRDSDIVIAVPETPYVYVITVDVDSLGKLTFSPIEFFEVGFDVQEIAIEATDATNRHALITNDGNTLRLHESTLEFGR